MKKKRRNKTFEWNQKYRTGNDESNARKITWAARRAWHQDGTVDGGSQWWQSQRQQMSRYDYILKGRNIRPDWIWLRYFSFFGSDYMTTKLLDLREKSPGSDWAWSRKNISIYSNQYLDKRVVSISNVCLPRQYQSFSLLILDRNLLLNAFLTENFTANFLIFYVLLYYTLVSIFNSLID